MSQDVTASAVAAMEYSGEERKKLIDRRVPRFARFIFYTFAGAKGTKTYQALDHRELICAHKLVQKKASAQI